MNEQTFFKAMNYTNIGEQILNKPYGANRDLRVLR